MCVMQRSISIPVVHKNVLEKYEVGVKICFLLTYNSFVSNFDKLSIWERFELTLPIGNAAYLLQNGPP